MLSLTVSDYINVINAVGFITLMACSHAGADETKLSCLVCSCVHTANSTSQFCRVSDCVHTANADTSKVGRDETKLSCRRCEQAITHSFCVLQSYVLLTVCHECDNFIRPRYLRDRLICWRYDERPPCAASQAWSCCRSSWLRSCWTKTILHRSDLTWNWTCSSRLFLTTFHIG